MKLTASIILLDLKFMGYTYKLKLDFGVLNMI